MALLEFQTLSTAYNVYGRWVASSTRHPRHPTHHVRGRYNYGLHFLFWDRWMGTVDPHILHGNASLVVVVLVLVLVLSILTVTPLAGVGAVLSFAIFAIAGR